MKNLVVGYAHHPHAERGEEYLSRFGIWMPLHPHYFNMSDNQSYYAPGTDLKFTLLSAEEETRLFTVARGGRYTATEVSAARDYIITNHLLFAATYARRIVKGKLPDNEVVSAANFGLMKAFEAFDHKRGKRFSCYAKPYIRSEIATLWRSKDIVDYHGNFPDVTEDNVAMLDPDCGVVMPDNEGDSRELVLKCLEDAKQVLNAKEAKILRMHYEQGLNMREIADTFDITRERIRQIHDVAIAKLARAFKRAGVNAQGEV
jgi:RNA polymerase sigma factor (sigma-70 family)